MSLGLSEIVLILIVVLILLAAKEFPNSPKPSAEHSMNTKSTGHAAKRSTRAEKDIDNAAEEEKKKDEK